MEVRGLKLMMRKGREQMETLVARVTNNIVVVDQDTEAGNKRKVQVCVLD